MRWTTKRHPRGPSDYDIGVLTPDGMYSSLKNLLDVEDGDFDPSSSLPRIINEARGQLSSNATRPGLPSSPSWHPGCSRSPASSIMYERPQDQPNVVHSDDTHVYSSVHLIEPGRMDGHTATPTEMYTLPISIAGTGHTSSIQSLSEPYTSELSFALLPGPSPCSSQKYGTPTVGTPQHLPHSNLHVTPAVSQARSAPLYSVAPDHGASLARCIAARAVDAQHHLPPGTMSAHSTPRIHVMTAMQTSQTTLENSWNNLDFPAMSVTPITCSTSFSADCALAGEFEQHDGSGVTSPSLCLTDHLQSNDLLEAGVTDNYWQLNHVDMHFSPMHRPRGLSPIDMGVYQLPGGEGDETANNLYDDCFSSDSFPVIFSC